MRGWVLFVLALLAVAATATSAMLALSSDDDGNNLLANGGFEAEPTEWRTLRADLARVTTPVAEGAYAASLSIDEGRPDGTIRQRVPAKPGGTYRFRGQVLLDDPSVREVQFKLEWARPDGGFTAIGASTHLQQASYQELTTFELPIPCTASDVLVTVLAFRDFTQVGPAIVYLDDLQLIGSASPDACPTATPSSTPSATLTATLSFTPTSLPSATPSATPTVTASATPTSLPSATPSVTPGATPSSTATRSPPATPTVTPGATASSTPTPLPSATPTATPTVTASSTPTRSPSATPSLTLRAPTAGPTLTPSNGLLVNGGFEAADGERPVGWRTFGGVLSRVSEPSRSGTFAGAFFTSGSSTKWLYQTVTVTPTAWYDFGAFTYHDNPWVESVLLRISWYESSDGTGSAVATSDSLAQLTEPHAGYRKLTTGPVQAPPGVHSANPRILLRPRTEVSALIYVDDASFLLASPPPTLTATPSATASPTSPVALTLTPSPTPSATATPVATAPRFPTMTPAPAPIETPEDAPPPSATVATHDGLVTRSPTLPPTLTPSETMTPSSTSTAAPHTPDGSEAAVAPTPSHGMLVNGGFEATADGSLAGWRKHGGVLSQVQEPVRSGRFAAAFFSTTASTKWAFQAVSVEPTAWYELSGFVFQSDPQIEAAWLRVSWYESEDASGSALVAVDSTEVLEVAQPGYRLLTTGPVRAPPTAHSASARVLLRPRSAVSALIYVDDVAFLRAAPPAVPVEPAEPETVVEPAGRSPSESTGRNASGGAQPAASRETPSSAVLGARVVATAGLTPQPDPVIRRNSLRSPAEQPSGGSATWLPWFGGAAIALASVVWTEWRVRRSRGAIGNRPIIPRFARMPFALNRAREEDE